MQPLQHAQAEVGDIAEGAGKNQRFRLLVRQPEQS
jgi:hypothetical protein